MLAPAPNPRVGRSPRSLIAAIIFSSCTVASASSNCFPAHNTAFALSKPTSSLVNLAVRTSAHHTLGSVPSSRLRPSEHGRGLLRMSGAGTSSVLHTGMKDLAEKYDAFLIDQWGVMHDGTNAYEAATECMKQLTDMGKKVVLLSNSSRRRGKSLDKLDTMGFESKAIIDLVTSGEVAWKGFTSETKSAPFHELEGTKCFVFGNGEEDEEYIKACGLEFAEIEEADFILARGMFTMHDSEDILKRSGPDAFEMWDAEALRVLQIAASRLLPMLVTNPDFVRPDGNDSPMPGKVGAMYESVLSNAMFGGRLVFYVGKPHRLVYDEAFRLLAEANGGEAVPRERVCAVGDSLHHDILGALRYGVDSILIADGVHAEELGMQQGKKGQAVDMAELDQLHDKLFTKAPDFVIPHFQWQGE